MLMMKKHYLLYAAILSVVQFFILFGTEDVARAQNNALPFVAMVFNPAEAGTAGVSISEFGASCSSPTFPVMNEKTGNVATGWMSITSGDHRTSYFSADAGMKIKEKFGVSITSVYGLCEPYEAFNSGGYSLGTFRPHQMIAGAGFSYRPVKFLSAGIRLKYAGEKLSDDANYGAFVSDIAITSEVPLKNGISIRASVGVYSLGTKIKASDGSSYSLPTSAKAEICYLQEFASVHRIQAAGSAEMFFSRQFAASAGLSYTWNSMLTVRCGYHYGGKTIVPSYVSAGIGVKFFGVSLDAAYIFGSEILRNSLGLSLGYAF